MRGCAPRSDCSSVVPLRWKPTTKIGQFTGMLENDRTDGALRPFTSGGSRPSASKPLLMPWSPGEPW